MKQALAILGIIVIIILGGGIYLQYHQGTEIMNLSFGRQTPKLSETEQEHPENQVVPFKNQGQAPEITGITSWLNSDPVTLESLRGKVILIDFWTYSCINCIRTLPYVTNWYDTYKDQGFVVIGVHTPEFAFEKVSSNVATALTRYKINYPVALDNNYKTWNAFNNQFWPAHYLIDKNGDIVYTHFGEGQYQTTEKAIRTLLGLEGDFTPPAQAEENQAGTPEIYLGSARLKNFGGNEEPAEQTQIYTFPKKLAKNTFALEGQWRFEPEAVTQTSDFGKIRLNFTAAKVFMVAQSAQPATVKIYIDGKLQKGITVQDSNLYPLWEANTGATHTLEIESTSPGLQIFTFTFG